MKKKGFATILIAKPGSPFIKISFHFKIFSGGNNLIDDGQ